ncbi:FAD/NAD(P)-binding domain-containing protein [Hymenopellis radicata]|nr:FAD/NAD(P)-binding domain-containing protein [Hymenopellis radicata]
MTIAKQRILVVGAGAAGMSCATGLAQHPEQFDVTLVEAKDYCGGQMFSIPLETEKFGAPWMNQGVQGASYIYHHTFKLFRDLGHDVYPVDLQVSFGKGDTFWTNVFPSDLVSRHAKEIRRFNWALKIFHWFGLCFAMVPIKTSLKLFLFSDEFINTMIYPSLALFLGTGNATPELPTIIMERLYTSPTYGMWYPVDKQMLTSNLPPMVVFPEATAVYTDWQRRLEKQGVHVRLSTEVLRVTERSKLAVKVELLQKLGEPLVEEYDQIVLCVLADTALKILGEKSRWIERKVLGATRWSDDVTVTHNDSQYMKKWYEMEFCESLAVRDLHGRDESNRVAEAKEVFKPMYLIKQVPSNPRLLEMSFDCSAFQYQLPKNTPLDCHVFQTIFLNDKDSKTWSKNEIDPVHVIREDWWHQLCHGWTHYMFVVPFMWLLNGRQRTTYAGSWTLVNAHEVAVISGLAAAYSLGADYIQGTPYDAADQSQSSWAPLCFRLYLLLSHMIWFKRGRTGNA